MEAMQLTQARPEGPEIDLFNELQNIIELLF